MNRQPGILIGFLGHTIETEMFASENNFPPVGVVFLRFRGFQRKGIDAI